MKRYFGGLTKHVWLLMTMLLFGWANTSAQEEVRDTTRVYFRQNVSILDTLYVMESESLPAFVERIKPLFNDTLFTLKNIHVVGSSSPEGPLRFNQKLAHQRALSVASYLKEHLFIVDSLLQVSSKGVDWEDLKTLVARLENLPNRVEVMEVLEKDYGHNERLWRLKQINRRIPYRWLYKHVFPLLRCSRVIVSGELKPLPLKPEVLPDTLVIVTEEQVQPVVTDSVETQAPAIIETDVDASRNVYWALKTNALYDVALVPNVGVEVYLGKQWSVAGNWMHAWWSNRGKNNFWRIYGGDVEVRRWFGKKAAEKPLQGHHLGMYGQLVTYDFEFGGRGYLGDKWTYGAGVSYGYSLPLAKRLNMDFTLGLGYLGGEYKEYLPIEGHYVWQVTKRLHWWGPTKAEVSLVWLLGKQNTNPKKGGRP